MARSVRFQRVCFQFHHDQPPGKETLFRRIRNIQWFNSGAGHV